MKLIGDRISIKSSADRTTAVIGTRIQSWKESLLAGWIVCWLICIVVINYYIFQTDSNQEIIFLFAITLFMLYYAYRIIKVYAWRKWGMEYLKISDEAITYKRSIRGYGKARVFPLSDVKKVSIITKEDGSFAKVLEESFWVMGGERISFEYDEKQVRIGMQLSDKDAKEFGNWLNDLVKKRKRQLKDDF